MNISELDHLDITPRVCITRSIDKSTGTASFIFQDPEVYDKLVQHQLYLQKFCFQSEQTSFFSHSVELFFQQGKPEALIIIFILKNREEWYHFSQAMNRYADDHQLVFNQKNFYDL